MFTVFVVGEKSGKSSFINSLAGDFVAKVGPLPKTKDIARYKFRGSKARSSNKDNKFHSVKIKYEFNMDVFDFPSIEKCKKDIKKLMPICDLILFITCADTAMIRRSEQKHYRFIENLVEKKKESGRYVKSAIVVNKTDNITYDTSCIFDTITGKKFRYSSHRAMLNSIIKCDASDKFAKREMGKILSNLRIYPGLISNTVNYCQLKELNIPKGDHDNLLGFIKDQIYHHKYHNDKYMGNFIKKIFPLCVDEMNIKPGLFSKLCNAMSYFKDCQDEIHYIILENICKEGVRKHILTFYMAFRELGYDQYAGMLAISERATPYMKFLNGGKKNEFDEAYYNTDGILTYTKN